MEIEEELFVVEKGHSLDVRDTPGVPRPAGVARL